jgi:superoxide dismutase
MRQEKSVPMRQLRFPRTSTFSAGRRRTLRAVVMAGGAAIAACSRTADASQTPKETGLSFEGLLKGEPGFQPRSPAPLPVKAIPGFLSAAQLARTDAVYRRAFADLLDAEHALQRAPRDQAHRQAYAALRARQVRAANDVLLHEFFVRNLSLTPVQLSSYVLSNLNEHMGSLETWRIDFAACAGIAERWAVLTYDPYDDRWHNLPFGDTDAGGMIGNNPLVVCAVAADAWSGDYSDRDTYVARFLEHIDWNVVAKRYRAVDRQ